MNSALARQPLPLVLVLTGPTGTGKTELALQLAARFPLEIISVDSAQVFRGMDIGTAKPTPAQRAQVAHHLIDIRDPAQSYSAGEFVRDARAAIADIHDRGRLPLLAGGTMLYLRALLRGMAQLPVASPTLRAGLEQRAARLGWPALHAELAAVDPVAAARIHPNDPQRIQRALEVHGLTGQPISEWQRKTVGAAGDFRWLRVGLIPADRAAHRQRLAHRFAVMLQAGFADEVLRLYRRGDLSGQMPSMRAVGYRQLWEWCAGRMELAAASAAVVTATAQLAKRQLTWLRSDRELLQVDAVEPSTATQVAEILGKAIDSG